MPKTATTTAIGAAAPTPRDDRRPIVFLNPNVLAKVVRVGFTPQSTSTGYRPGGVSMRDEPAEALAQLVADAGALLVCTDAPIGGFDTRQFMLDRGVRGDAFGPEWFATRVAGDRRLAIEAWLTRHGNPPAIVIDRPEAEPRSRGGKLIALTIAEGSALASHHAREAARLLTT